MASRLSPTVNWRRRCSRMANAKRASMREGPLAALFRKTEGSEEEPDAPKATASAAARRTRRTPAGGAPHPALNASGDAAASGEGDAPAARVPTPKERLRHA